MRKFILSVVGMVMLIGSSLWAQDISGDWQGTLQTGKGPGMRVLLKIPKADGSASKAVLYNVDQAGEPMAVTTLAVNGLKFNFTIKPLDVTYEGTLNSDRTLVTGNATLHGQTHVLNLSHVSEDNAWAIPEPPKPMPADAKPKFDVLTVKPSDPNQRGKLFTIHGRHVMTINTSVNDLITFGYAIQLKQLANAPAWMDEKFDLDGIPDVQGRPNNEQMRMLMQDALVQRFGLKFHHTQRELAAYVLTVAKSGEKMTVTGDKPSAPGDFLFRKLGELRVTNSTMKAFCDGMQEAVMDKPVVDQTGLTDRYDFNLSWTPDDSQFLQFGPRPLQPVKDDPNAPPSLYTALQEQLGLKLSATKANVDVMVIDHIDKPSAN